MAKIEVKRRWAIRMEIKWQSFESFFPRNDRTVNCSRAALNYNCQSNRGKDNTTRTI